MTCWVLLRGWAREARHWGRFPAALQALLPPGDLVLALDLPGNGARHRERSATDIVAAVHSVRAALAERGEAGPFVLVALSLGGMVAMEWARRHPDELQACVLVNSSARGLAPFWQRLRPASYLPLMGLLRPGLAPAQREARILRLTSNLRRDDEPLAREWAQWARQCPVSRANALRQLWAALRFRAPREAPRVPVLVVASQMDRFVSPACSRAIARRWNVPMILHPEAGHDLPLDAPQWLAGKVIRWWARMPA